MTMIGNLDDVLENFSRRLYALEQGISTPGNYGGGNSFDEIELDDPDDELPPVILRPIAPNTPLNVVATPGSHFDVTYVDVEWEGDLDGEAPNVYEVELSEETAPGVYEIAQVVRTAGTSIRILNLEPNTDYGVRVTAMSRIGLVSDPTAWTDFNSGADNTVPAQITGVLVDRGATSAVVRFTPSANVDVAGGKGLYEVQIDTANTFNTANLQTIRTTSWVVAFNAIQTESNYYARVSAIDSSGNQGPWSAVAGPTVIGGVIDNMVVAGLSAAKITVGTMSGDRISANTLDAGTIKTSSITSADITLAGGSFKAGSPPTTGLLINSQGIRLYAAGVQTITLDAATGAATFRGTVSGGSIDSSTITGGSISGASITGGTISVASGAVVLNSSGITIAGGTGTSNKIKWSDGSTIYGNGNTIYLAAAGVILGGAGGIYIENSTSFFVLDDITCLGTMSCGSLSTSALVGNTLNVGGGDMTVSSAGAISGAAVQVSGLVSGNTLDIGGGDFTVSSSGAVGAGSNVTTAGKFFTQGYDTASTVPSAQVLSGGEIRRTTHANSSLRYKENLRVIKDSEVDWKGLMKIKPSRYDLREGILTRDEERYNQYGLVAEEVVKVLPEVVQLDEKGRPDLVDYSKLSVFLLMWIQKLQKEVDALKSAA